MTNAVQNRMDNDILSFASLDKDLGNCLSFILEVGKLKSVLRQTHLSDLDRKENSAEHSWHLVMMAIVLQKYANMRVDLERVIKMLAVHDVGEIDTGDVFHYSKTSDNQNEKECIERLFQNLDGPLKAEFLRLWDEFEAAESVESKFARALDRFQPFLYMLQNGGESWKRNKISYVKALKKNEHIAEGSVVLWETYQTLAAEAQKNGLFYEEEG